MTAIVDLPFEVFKEITTNCLDKMTGRISMNNQCSNNNEDQELLISIFTQLTYSTIVEDDILKIFDLTKTKFILESFNNRKLDIALNLLKEQNASIKPVLDNFDWKVNWIIGSSASTTLRYPILNLDFSILKKENDKLTKEYICSELTKDELDKLISVLDNIVLEF